NGTVGDSDGAVVQLGQAPALTLTKHAAEASYSAVGDVLHYTFDVENTGNVSLAGPVAVTDDKATDESCPDLTTVGNLDAFLDPGEPVTCTASYTTPQSDLNAGHVTNNASASADGTDSNTDPATVNAVQSPALTLVKDATETSYNAAGQVLHYSYTV